MRIFCLLYFGSLLSAAYAADEPHAYLKEGYNEYVDSPKRAVSKFLEIVFPDTYGRDLLEFDGHFERLTGNPKANIVILPDLADGISTRASTMQYIQRLMAPKDAVLFAHDPINREARNVVPPQTFRCQKALIRAPKYIDLEEFKKEFWGSYLGIHNKSKKWEASECYRLGLPQASPREVAKYVNTISEHDYPPKRYFIVMDQLQMPGQAEARYAVQDWDAAFGSTGYVMYIDQYANTGRQ